MTEPNPTTSRRSFLGTTGLVAAGSALAGVAIPAVHAAEDNTIRVALDRLRGKRHGGGRRCAFDPAGPDQARRDGRRLRGPALLELRHSGQGAQRQGRRELRAQVHRLRRLQERDGRPEAGRRGDPRHAAGVSLGALHLRHPEGAAHLHGEAGDRRRTDDAQDDCPGRRGQEEEPEGGRRADVPALRGARRAA